MTEQSKYLNELFAQFEKQSGGYLGIAAKHIESKKTIFYRGDEKFFMCSTYKVPMALLLLKQVEQGLIKLTDHYVVTEYDLRPGVASTLNQFDYSTTLTISFQNLLQVMMQESCNSATDIILRKIGGPTAVTQYLHSIAIEDMRVDNYTLESIAYWDGIHEIPTDHRITLAQYQLLEKAVTPEDSKKAKEQFRYSKNNTCTPLSIMSLLEKFFNKELINAIHSEFLLKIMRGCKRGGNRMMSMLPPHTPVAHKTGTLPGYTCDVGIITLPFQAGHVAISVYIMYSTKDLSNNEKVIAEVSRSVYDYFLFMQ